MACGEKRRPFFIFFKLKLISAIRMVFSIQQEFNSLIPSAKESLFC
jgi:hypothetical protein